MIYIGLKTKYTPLERFSNFRPFRQEFLCRLLSWKLNHTTSIEILNTNLDSFIKPFIEIASTTIMLGRKLKSGIFGLETKIESKTMFQSATCEINDL